MPARSSIEVDHRGRRPPADPRGRRRRTAWGRTISPWRWSATPPRSCPAATSPASTRWGSAARLFPPSARWRASPSRARTADRRDRARARRWMPASRARCGRRPVARGTRIEVADLFSATPGPAEIPQIRPGRDARPSPTILRRLAVAQPGIRLHAALRERRADLVFPAEDRRRELLPRNCAASSDRARAPISPPTPPPLALAREGLSLWPAISACRAIHRGAANQIHFSGQRPPGARPAAPRRGARRLCRHHELERPAPGPGAWRSPAIPLWST